MKWQERITVDPDVLVGKPVVQGTRIAVEFVIDLLAQGWTEDQIIDNYPRLTRQDISACLFYFSDLLKRAPMIELPQQQQRRILDSLGRITHNPEMMGGRPCIRGLRVTVGTVLGLLASDHSPEEILRAYPYLEKEDIQAALSYAAKRTL